MYKRPLRYKRYLWENVAIPRSTAYKRRKRLEKESLLLTQTNATAVTSGETPQGLCNDSICDSSENSNYQEICSQDEEKSGSQYVNEPSLSPLSPCREESNDLAQLVAGPSPHHFSGTCEKTSSDEGGNSSGSNIFDEGCDFSGSNAPRISDDEVTFTVGVSNNQVGRTRNNPSRSTLCPCTSITDTDVVLMCLAMGLRHGLTWEAQLDIFRLINTIYREKKISATKYTYFKHLKENQSEIIYHVFCNECNKYIGERAGKEGSINCPNCNKLLETAAVENFFLSVPLETQLRSVLKFPNVADSLLTYRQLRKKSKVDAYEDIYDGLQYRKLCMDGGVLSKPENFSYTFFTDGVSVGKSSNKTMWPIYLTLNELPPKERQKHILLAGLYVGPHDPDHKYFLEPFVRDSNNLSNIGFTWEHKGKTIRSKVVPLVCVLDSVARFQVMNVQSFHGKQACTYCYIKQKHTRKGLKYVCNPMKKIEERTHQSFLKDLENLERKRDEPTQGSLVERGVKGASSLLNLKYFNFGAAFVVDYMHAVLIGSFKTHIEILLTPACKKFWKDIAEENLGMEHVIAAIDQRLLMIKPPSSITRTPRPMSNRKLWRANEWRTWLLYYCLPCLTGLLKKKYLLHLAMLSKAISIFLMKSITPDQLHEADILLKSYVYYFQEYFGEEEMLYNFHLLLHIGKCVKNWGPLWAYNSFLYESQNRFLLELRKSANQVVTQVVRKYLIFFAFPLYCEELASTESSLEFCGDVLNRNLKIFVRCGQVILIGIGKPWISTLSKNDCVNEFCEVQPESCVAYSKMTYNGKRFSPSDYHHDLKNDNSHIFLTDNSIAVIRDILLTPNLRVILLVQKICVEQNPFLSGDSVTLDHIYKFERFGHIFCIDPEMIENHCVNMTVNDNVYLTKIAFGCFGD